MANPKAPQPDRLAKALAIAWLVAALLNVRALLAVPIATWVTTSVSWLSLWGLGTHIAGITLAPLGAVLVWRGHGLATLAILLLAGNALMYWTFCVLILRTTYWPVLCTLVLAAATLVALLARATRYLVPTRTE